MCPAKAGVFTGRQSHQGKSQEPCSLDSREEGNRIPRAHRQSHRRIVSESSGRNESTHITAAGTLQGNGSSGRQGTVSANGSLLAPIPVFGPEFRVYFTHRVYFQGNFYGMYFFGYGNFLSSSASSASGWASMLA